MSSSAHPVLPLRDVVVFPSMIVPLFVGRKKSVRALEGVTGDGKQILLVSQKDAAVDEPSPDDIYKVGVLANVLQLLELPGGTVKVLVEGQARARIRRYLDNEAYLEAEVEELVDEPGDATTLTALTRAITREFERYAKVRKNIPDEAIAAITEAADPGRLADLVAGHLGIEVAQKQQVLEIPAIEARLDAVYGHIQNEINVLKVERKIKTRVKSQMERTQREYYLNEQMKAIQRELGDSSDTQNELDELKEKIAKTELSDEAREKAGAELKKLRMMNPMSAESGVVRNYLDWLLALPWGTYSSVKTDLLEAQAVLDGDHYGLEKVKERIIEYLAVQQRSSKLKGPIMCLVGPPGVGKTSLGASVARATGREFVRISLGGVRDEAEIRGHRRTYIGSMPGKIIQSLKKAKTANPLILLDEIDKMGYDFRGDPAAAMLEVLDPEQNNSFTDHYLEVEFDLSRVMFITTANTHAMPPALLDRLEIIPLSGYTEDEKAEIARRHLIPKQIGNHGLRKTELKIRDDALTDVLRHYTREAGVRNLEREIAKVVRKTVTKIVRKERKRITITSRNINEFLGVQKFRFGLADDDNQIGVVNGLAYTSTGGELLRVEALKLPGRGRMKTTGKLGDVMKESIAAASSYVRSISPEIGIKPNRFENLDIHVHVPEGATPKDGPSAGLTMVTSIVSVLTGIPVHRDIAMTGEVTLRGNALAVGGLKEKLLAALRGGIATVFIPDENRRDLEEIPDNVKEGLEIVPVKHVSEVLERALIGAPTPVEWDWEAEEEAIADSPPPPSEMPGAEGHTGQAH